MSAPIRRSRAVKSAGKTPTKKAAKAASIPLAGKRPKPQKVVRRKAPPVRKKSIARARKPTLSARAKRVKPPSPKLVKKVAKQRGKKPVDAKRSIDVKLYPPLRKPQRARKAGPKKAAKKGHATRKIKARKAEFLGERVTRAEYRYRDYRVRRMDNETLKALFKRELFEHKRQDVQATVKMRTSDGKIIYRSTYFREVDYDEIDDLISDAEDLAGEYEGDVIGVVLSFTQAR